MKELSIEEKAKAYDEAKIRGSQLWESDAITRENYEYIFPELKESEDEKIRKIISDILLIDSDEIREILDTNNVLMQDVIAWLEKQQKPVISDDALREGIAHFGITQYQIDNWLKKYVDVEKQGEQNYKIIKDKNYLCVKTHNYAGVEWIRGTKYYASDNYTLVNQGCECYCPEYSKEEHNNLFEEVKCDGCVEKQNEQKLAEWSKEDETMLNCCLGAVNTTDYFDKDNKDKMKDWLYNRFKSLRPQNTWKPTKRQLLELSCVISGCSFDTPILVELEEDLKKLTEE